MRLLIVGGTSFVGRAIAWSAIGAGHDVTVINRGETPTDLDGHVTRLKGDRDHDLSALEGLSFDATVDAIAYRPAGVATLHRALGDRGGHHLQISTVSAYNEPTTEGATEDDLTLRSGASEDPAAPIDAESYGPLKAACELAAQQYFAERLTIVRPTYIIGSHDATLRFPYWPQRLQRGGDVAVPGPRSNALQTIDARDLADFVVHLLSTSTYGAFHVANPYPPLGYIETIERIADEIAPKDTRLVEISYEHIARHHLDSRFPLWSGAHRAPIMTVDSAKAITAGLRCRDLADSVRDTLEWWADRTEPSWWLTREQEAMLIRTSADRGPRRGPGGM